MASTTDLETFQFRQIRSQFGVELVQFGVKSGPIWSQSGPIWSKKWFNVDLTSLQRKVRQRESQCQTDLCVDHQVPGMSDFDKKWVRLAPNATNPGLFQRNIVLNFLSDLKKMSRVCPVWCLSDQLLAQILYPCACKVRQSVIYWR